MSLESDVLDAIRVKDGSRVSMKVVRADSDEIRIARFLCAAGSHNHCVPVEDVLPDPLDKDNALLIMPYLRRFDDPPFEAVQEVMDFIQQTLEGLCYIHGQRVAHRDCSSMNIMMDGRPLFPNDHHPVHTNATLDSSRRSYHLSRPDHPVKYYFIDFGMSSHFKQGESPYVLGAQGGDQDVPELSNEHSYNAYMLDVFILGHLYEKEFVQNYLGLEFLKPLVAAMTSLQPERRPTAESALGMFHTIHNELNHTQLHWRLRKGDESGAERVVYDTISAAKVGFSLVRGLIGYDLRQNL
ncbi:hypothetical protein EIP91_001081 [Steccherinum ochraceum]|uniref:Protein kinase domain-containing protein n=1 Tax=Steccherinum ochraceum TaxID=92696 RepID=A0A4R0RIN1_9APHY|nr:hypothetical protein EIP91_001081 [Steccherinum ochraceum]